MSGDVSGLLDAEPISIITAGTDVPTSTCLFDRIELLECDDVPAQMREQAFEATWDRAWHRLNSLVHSVYEPCLTEICSRLHDNNSLLIPATIIDASAGAHYEALPTWLAERFDQHECLTVHIQPAHCVNISTTLTAFVSQLAQYIPNTPELAALCQAYSQNDLALILALYNASNRRLPRVVLLLHEIQTYPVSILNDFLKAIISWTEFEEKAPHLHIVASFTAPLPLLPRNRLPSDLFETSSWITAILTEQVRMHLDVVTVSLPDKSEFWERVVCTFFAQPSSGIWLGRSIFELIRRRYWHTTASFDAVAQCVRLAYIEHFRTRPLTAFVQHVPSLDALKAHWTPEMLALLRVIYFSACTSQDTPQMHALAHDDRALVDVLTDVQNDLVHCMTSRTIALITVQELLHTLHMTGVYGTKLGVSGCTAIALEWMPPYTDWDASGTTANALTATTPTAQQVHVLLEHLCNTLSTTQVEALVDAISLRVRAVEAALNAEAAAAVRKTHTALLRAKSSLNAGRSLLTGWVTSTWHTCMQMPPHLGLAVWSYDFAEPVATMLESAARSTLFLALDAPTDTLASMSAAACTASGQREQSVHATWYEAAEHSSEVDVLRRVRANLANASIPDVCRLFALYKDSSRFINLADWYDAFVQSLEGEEKRRKNADAQEEDVVASVQMRFSLAVNELAYMGLIGPVGRKVEHVSRLVWDLPVSGMEEA